MSTFIFQGVAFQETQLRCDPCMKLVLNLGYFDSYFLLLRAKVYNPTKASTPSSTCLNADNPVSQSILQEICFQSL